MIPQRRKNLRAVRAGAKSAADFELFDYLCAHQKAMRTSAREDEADDVARNMARIYELMLKYGQFFEPSPRPKKYKAGDRNECYGNSLDLVIAHDELNYCEGYIAVERIPVPMEHVVASIVKEKNGRKKIQFTDSGGKRQTVRLGITTIKQAEAVKTKVETILGDLICGRPHDDEVSRWLGSLHVTLRKRMEKKGLVKGGGGREAPTLKTFLDEFFKNLTVKPSTATIYSHTKRCLIDHFGAGTPIRSIDPTGADKWRQYLKSDGLSEATISGRVMIARQMFKLAVKWRIVVENPFTDVKTGSQKNKTRMYFVTRNEAQKVLDACPDLEWRLLFALSRFGGLRCPSEHLGLRWADIDWEKSRILVHSPKTERHKGGECRLVPLFPDLRPYLLEAFETAEEGAEFVITRYRLVNANLRTHLRRIIRKAGLIPWPKTFHNLRSTRQTELSEEFPAHVVCAWLGNSEEVAKDHYLQVTDAHFARAAQDKIDKADSKAAQNAAQQSAVDECSPTQPVPPELENHENFSECGETRQDTTRCNGKELCLVGAEGFEPSKA